MTDESGGGLVERGVVIVLSLIAFYLCLTALPTFLGLVGVLSPPGGPHEIADALARLFVGVFLLGVVLAIEWVQERRRGGT